MLPEFAGATILERALYMRIDQHWRNTRQPVQTKVLADLVNWNEAQMRRVLGRMEEKGLIRRKGERGGWLPARQEAGEAMQTSILEQRVMRRRTRKDDVLEYICRIARENNGATPKPRAIAAALGLSQTRIHQIMMRLQIEGRITYVDRYTYKVEQSVWEPPPYVEL